MKKYQIFSLAAGLFVAALGLYSCQKESALTSATLEDVKVTSRAVYDCAVDCLDPADPDKYAESGYVAQNESSSSRTFNYTVYNTMTGFIVEWNYTADNNAKRDLKFELSGTMFDGTKSFTIVDIQGAGFGSQPFDFDYAWEACDVVSFTASILGGTDVSTSGTYALYADCCTENFTYTFAGYDGEGNHRYTFCYTPEESVEDAHLVLTLAQADMSYVSLDGWYIPGNENAQNIQTDLDLVACTEYCWTITLKPLCLGSQPASNVWTDFTVNDVSKKGDLDNISIDCPE